MRAAGAVVYGCLRSCTCNYSMSLFWQVGKSVPMKILAFNGRFISNCFNAVNLSCMLWEVNFLTNGIKYFYFMTLSTFIHLFSQNTLTKCTSSQHNNPVDSYFLLNNKNIYFLIYFIFSMSLLVWFVNPPC